MLKKTQIPKFIPKNYCTFSISQWWYKRKKLKKSTATSIIYTIIFLINIFHSEWTPNITSTNPRPNLQMYMIFSLGAIAIEIVIIAFELSFSFLFTPPSITLLQHSTCSLNARCMNYVWWLMFVELNYLHIFGSDRNSLFG
jgi:hypothetical protein